MRPARRSELVRVIQRPAVREHRRLTLQPSTPRRPRAS